MKCYRDKTRECGQDCVAFSNPNKKYPTSCRVINSLGLISKAAWILCQKNKGEKHEQD